MNDDIEQNETIDMSYSEGLKKSVIAALQTVYDPEMESINVYDLGLIYMLDVQENGNVLCEHTLTSMMCPFADQICQDISDAIKSVDGVTNVERKLVFDPPFSTDMVSEDSKMIMGLW
jgi:metal-sulfur cluster biosynthetic enzyme